MPGNAMQSRGEGYERAEGQACEREQKLNQRDGEYIESGGVDLPITR